jgi:hypothetical protein
MKRSPLRLSADQLDSVMTPSADHTAQLAV